MTFYFHLTTGPDAPPEEEKDFQGGQTEVVAFLHTLGLTPWLASALTRHIHNAVEANAELELSALIPDGGGYLLTNNPQYYERHTGRAFAGQYGGITFDADAADADATSDTGGAE